MLLSSEYHCLPSWKLNNAGLHLEKGTILDGFLYDIAKTLGPRARALSFSGCDTVSAFTWKGKKSCWKVWNVFPDTTEVFSRLSNPIDNVGSDCLDIIEAFIVLMYDRYSSTADENEDRFDLFARKKNL
jgi:hypothetical protein